MKKLVFGVIATVMFALFGTAQNKATINSCVTQEEYANSDKVEMVIVDHINAAVAGLKGIALESSRYSKYQAIVTLSTANEKMSGVIIASQEEDSGETANAGNCHVCGVSSAMSCVRKVKSYMTDHGMTTITITITIEAGSGCVSIHY